jgi:hypothetical protein
MGTQALHTAMVDKPDADKLKGPGGLNLRELHELVKKSHARDQATGKQHNKLAQPQNRWQRFVRYVWDKKKG